LNRLKLGFKLTEDKLSEGSPTFKLESKSWSGWEEIVADLRLLWVAQDCESLQALMIRIRKNTGINTTIIR
jgi:hypothetical protein